MYRLCNSNERYVYPPILFHLWQNTSTPSDGKIRARLPTAPNQTETCFTDCAPDQTTAVLCRPRPIEQPVSAHAKPALNLLDLLRTYDMCFLLSCVCVLCRSFFSGVSRPRDRCVRVRAPPVGFHAQEVREDLRGQVRYPGEEDDAEALGGLVLRRPQQEGRFRLFFCRTFMWDCLRSRGIDRYKIPSVRLFFGVW